MTEEQVKEQMSRHFVELIANRGGFKCSVSEPDHGCDLTVTKAELVELGGRKQFLETGRIIQVQLKSTCEAHVDRTIKEIKYDLAVKTYNALVARRNNGGGVPFLLVLLLLPDDDTQWLDIAADELRLRKSAFWYYPDKGAALSKNESTQRIAIPSANAVGTDFVAAAFQRFFA